MSTEPHSALASMGAPRDTPRATCHLCMELGAPVLPRLGPSRCSSHDNTPGWLEEPPNMVSPSLRYSVEGFLDKNKDTLFQDFKRLLYNRLGTHGTQLGGWWHSRGAGAG